MSPHDQTTTDESTADSPPTGDASTIVRRRRFLALGLGAGATMLAGCSGDGGVDANGENGDDPTAGSSTDTPATGSEDAGTFRLLISDRPNAIDDFDSLNVSFDRARVFRSGEDGDATATPAGTDGETDEDETETPTSDSTATTTENATSTENATADDETSDPTPTSATETPDGDDADGDDGGEDESDGEDTDGDAGGFTTMDLDGATVDLTEVVGSKAKNIFEGGLPAGRYTKIELHAAEIEGVVDGEPADVKLPSGKLMLTKPFEVEAGSTVSFVFDISVVKKGNGGYNLLPVVSESGVAGKDIEVEEVDDEGKSADESDDESEPAVAENGAGGGENESGDDGGTPTPTDTQTTAK